MTRREDLETFENLEVHQLESGQLIATHPFGKCAGQNCSIHNPSDHPMKDMPRLWRMDRKLMERICPHGVGHPDPDHIKFVEITRGAEAAYYEAIHGCLAVCTEECHK